MDEESAHAIALFRFSIISPVLHSHGKGQMEHFRRMASRTFDVPHYGRCRYRPAAFKAWLREYRKGGFDALKPKRRSDKGTNRIIGPELAQILIDKRKNYPALSGSAFYRLLVAEGLIDLSRLSEPTLRNFLKAQGLFKFKEEVTMRKKFEMEHINDLWLGDFMHAPSFTLQGRKRRVFLCAIIDDHSRMVVGARYFLRENTPALEITFKQALQRYGLCKRFYTDNGAVFSSQHLQHVCARLHISLIHSKPYDSPSRGKIERWFRTVRQRFLPLLDHGETGSLDDLNTRFAHWIDKEYHHYHHCGIQTRPIDRWMADLKDTIIQRLSEQELDRAFLQTFKRRVKKDATVSISGVLYEVPARYIGELIELRFPTDKPNAIYLYENGQPVCRIHKVNPTENARSPVSGIRFSNPESQGDDTP